ncbi:Pentatricopeptide repeat-containing protein [Acorus calamus]|uniref:Pentatricopeptide repeat-containing protein n=1 Tax=Acorus calamus TaxID=4465 RepID=A0AAV9ELC2_ACOCL|nr:Pentatricopeptide repeat-containing protein [Acorus calamus]
MRPFKPHPIIQHFTQLVRMKDLPSAMNALSSLDNHGLRADPVAYADLVKLCIANRAVRQGRLVHLHIHADAVSPETFLDNNLLNMYVKFGLLDDARALFDAMPERNVVSWTTMVSAYARARASSEESVKLLNLMRGEGVAPNMFTYSSVLRAAVAAREPRMLEQIHCGAIKHGLESDVFVRSALIDAYAKLGDPADGFRVFNEMETGDVFVWNSIIGGFAQNGRCDEALCLFVEMKRAGFRSSQATLTSALRACTGSARMEMGRQVHAHVVKFGPAAARDLILNNAVVDMYCKCGSTNEAGAAFARMRVRDVVSWSAMISGLAQNGRSGDALELFESMKENGPRPNHVTMVGVLFACSHAGLVDEGRLYFDSMRTLFDVEPGREHYGCMVDLLGRAGRLDEALKLIEEMEITPDSVIWRTLLGACKVHKNTSLAKRVAHRILELEPDDEGAYVLLSNTFAGARRWEGVETVRGAMRDRGVKKREPGCSWVEEEMRIHAFVAGDDSHPEMASIIGELKRLFSRIGDAGYVADAELALHDMEAEQREESMRYHSEKLAVAFAMTRAVAGKPIRVVKNLRTCGDCHAFAKMVSMVEGRDIVIRDAVRFHHFRGGACSCGDYW